MAFNQYSLDLEASSSQYGYNSSPSAGLKDTGDMTIEGWVKHESLPSATGSQTYISMRDNTSTQVTYTFYLQENSGYYLRLFHRNSSSATDTEEVAWTPSASKWYHLAVVISGSNVLFYVNGEQQGSTQTLSNSRTHNASAVLYFGTNTGSASFHDGLMNHFRFWSDARTQQELQDNMYNFSLSIGVDGLVEEWKFNNDATSESGNNNLTLSGSPTYSTNVPFTGANSTDWTSYALQTDNTKVSGSSDHTDIPLLIKDGNLSSAVYSGAGVSNYAIDLEASSSQYAYVADNTALSITGDISIEAWIKLESSPSTNGIYTIASKYKPSDNNKSYAFAYRDSSDTEYLYFTYSSNGSTAGDNRVAVTLTPGKWYHVACAFDASAHSTEFFVNGVSIGSDATHTATSIYDGTSSFYVGSVEPATGWHFDGLISNVRVWSDIRTQAEIIAGMNEVYTGTANNLVGSWYNNDNDSNDNAGTNNLTTSGSPTISSADIPIPDLRFTTDSAGTTEVPYEIVSFDKVSETSEIWIKYPTLSYNTNSSLYVWYGNSSAVAYDANAPFGSQEVWSDYRGVYHLQTTSDNAQILDSTANAHNSTTNTQDANSSGKIGYAGDYANGSSEYTDFGDQADHEFAGDFTVQVWFYRRTNATTNLRLLSKGAATNGVGGHAFWGSDSAIYSAIGNGTTRSITTGLSISLNTWYLTSLRRSSTSQIHGLDDLGAGKKETITAVSGTTAGGGLSVIGASAQTSPGLYWEGIVDEYRLRAEALSDDWLITEYNNQNDPSTFWAEVGGGKNLALMGVGK